jgi:hypothetical protein
MRELWRQWRTLPSHFEHPGRDRAIWLRFADFSPGASATSWKNRNQNGTIVKSRRRQGKCAPTVPLH